MRIALPLSLLLALASCRDAADRPGSGGAVRADLSIPVEIGGRAATTIDAALLSRTAPDFTAGERRAWRLRSLLGPALQPSMAVEVEDRDGVRTVFPLGGSGEREAVLVVNRSGDALVTMMSARDPFPAFHGRGGNRGRSGDAARRIRGLRRLRIAPAATGPTMLSVSSDGGPPAPFTRADLDRAKPLAMLSEGGEGDRDAWPLRELVATLTGAPALQVTLRGEGGRTVEIDRASWLDRTRLPVLRLNRRGQLKFQWISAAELEPAEGPELRGVTELRVAHR